MRKYMKKTVNCIIVCGLAAAVCFVAQGKSMEVQASSITDIQKQIDETKKNLDNINSKIGDIESAQEVVQEKIQDLNAEVVNMMTSIGMKEDEIATKEDEIVQKQADIDQTQLEYEAAKEREEKQAEATKVRIRRMYENGSASSLLMYLADSDIGDLLNRADFVEAVYDYDLRKLKEYQDTKQQVHDLWDKLEADKAQLEADKAQLVTDRENMKQQKAELDVLLAQKKKESANYEAEIKKAQQEANVQKKLLQQEQQKLKQMQSSSSSSNAANGNYTVKAFDVSIIDSASGSDLGKKIAKYACQYIGNPYVTGGTSLTNGADCSGFTYRVLKDFGYNLPRTSYEQRNAGTGISYSEAQPGDLVCYEGHVGIYVGGGYIVHASTPQSGIKVSNAGYRPIVSVRRII